MDRTIYLTILASLAVTIVCGAILTFAGESLFGDPAISRFGMGLTLVAGVVYLFFRMWARNKK